MNTRIEIFREGLWRQLRLRDGKAIRYNALINRIGKIDAREISHTNTFSLPSISQNTKALGINIFDPQSMARTLNSQFQAKYYVEDKILQQGFLIINNTIGGSINVNFIDEALEITEQWGSTTYNELIISKTIDKPSDYQDAINEMINYSMNKSEPLSNLGNVGSRGYKLAEFPNNLNAIGDAFQKDEHGVRAVNTFNPYQSRPIFNAKALFDLACESYGYLPIYAPSVDWSLVKNTYMIDEGLGENQRDDKGLVFVDYPKIASIRHFARIDADDAWFFWNPFVYPGGEVNSLFPSWIEGWFRPPSWIVIPEADLLSSRCIFAPNLVDSQDGEIRWRATVSPNYSTEPTGAIMVDIQGMWGTGGTGAQGDPTIVYQQMTPTVDNSTFGTADFTIDKAQIPLSKPANGINFIGFMALRYIARAEVPVPLMDPYVDLIDAYVTEKSLEVGAVAYDDFGQYLSPATNLTHAAPRTSVKDLMSAYMQKDGILMRIDSLTKTIKFFTYGHYQDQKEAGKFSDWSKYYQKHNSPKFNTDYGSSYFKRNQIGLSSPYTGNSFILTMANQGADSKFKDFGKNLVKNFKDIEGILKINNTAPAVPYFEYKNTGLGLIEKGTSLENLTQVRADGTVQGSLPSLTSMQNVNYATVPPGITEWYNLVDRAVKAEGTFLLPVNVIRELDLSEPIYVEGLGGFYIIEEVAEYVNAQAPVLVKLIKLIDNLKAV